MTDQQTETYQWFKDGQLLSPDDNVVIQQREELMVLSAEKSDSGVYTCVASNSGGSSNASAVVDVTSTIITCDGQLSVKTIVSTSILYYMKPPIKRHST